MRLIIVFILCTTCIPSDITSKTIRTYSKQRVVLISFDGFRHDYIERENLKAFKKFARAGVKATSLKPTFVTKTFPNHFTLSTGLYEESHGIIANHMYDPLYKEHFDKKSADDPKWWNASKPIWMLNEENVIDGTNKTGKSATIFWPGSEASYDGKFPSIYFKGYNKSFDTKQRFDTVVDLLLDHSDLNFIACYVDEPDETAHNNGPDSRNTSLMLKKLDENFEYFINKMDSANLIDKVNIIVVSDHGFTNIPKENIIYLNEHLTDLTEYDVDSYGVILQIRPKGGKGYDKRKKKIYQTLKKIQNIDVFYKHEIPERWHYKNNRRVPEIFAVAKQHFYIAMQRDSANNSVWLPKGDHGYDNDLKDMHGIFLARGPAFKKNIKINEVLNVDICPLLCHVLGIPEHPNNGSLSRIQNIIQEKNLFSVIMKNPALIIALLSICGIFVLIIILGCTVSCYRNFVESAKYRRLQDENVPLSEWHDDDLDDVTEFQMRR